MHSDDPVYRSHPISYLLSDSGIDTLAKTKSTSLTSTTAIVALLKESTEWEVDFGAEVFNVIQDYDLELEEGKRETRRVQRLARTAARLKARQMAG